MKKIHYCYSIILSLCLFYVVRTRAQELPADTTRVLNEVVVSANRFPETRRTVAQQVTVIDKRIIRNFNAQTMADLIQNTGTVSVQRSQQGGGSPILRGFEANKVLLVVDGVRMNNLIYRGGHLQNVITVDNNSLDRVEILFGPSSTVYGSDALGGVIHMFTRNPVLASGNSVRFSGNALTRYATANQEKTGHIDFSVGGNKIAAFTSFTYSDFGDLRMGEKINPSFGAAYGLRNQYVVRASDNQSDLLIDNADPYVQKFSGYRQWDLVQKVLIKSGNRISHLFNFQYSNTGNIPRYDRLTDPGGGGSGLRFAQWYYGPQKRIMGSYQLGIEKTGNWADSINILASYQNVEESRHDRRFNNNTLNHRIEKVYVLGLTADIRKTIGQHTLRYGLDGQFSSVSSTAYAENIVTGSRSSLDTRYPDGDNSLSSLSVFSTHTYTIKPVLNITDGLRLGYGSLQSTFVSQVFFPFPFNSIDQKNFVGSASLGVNYLPGLWKFSLLTSSGYRIPNVDDLAKVFETQTGSSTSNGKLIVPNPDLKPEKTLNGEVNITRFFGSTLQVTGIAFVTRFYDVIVTAPSQFNGQSTIIYDGFPADVFSSQNRDKGLIYGFHLSAQARFAKNFTATAAYNYTHGDYEDNSGQVVPLDHISPVFGRIGVQYNYSGFSAELFSNFNGWKRLSRYSPSGEDNLQYATPRGMPSWYTLNFRSTFVLNKYLAAQFGIDNIMDMQYRVFASGINAPGRNFIIALRATL
ncbi:MAG: hypothetical protein KatS3mg032_1396 [Cyclobacteriaceae bacterium]|nr:MAG: hypothetical protein KatS3mg032_1396 [Cyclobacteriaceae bacterium]